MTFSLFRSPSRGYPPTPLPLKKKKKAEEEEDGPHSRVVLGERNKGGRTLLDICQIKNDAEI